MSAGSGSIENADEVNVLMKSNVMKVRIMNCMVMMISLKLMSGKLHLLYQLW